MRASESDLLILPGLGGGDADIWFRRWAQKLSSARIVPQSDFDHPVQSTWVAAVRAEAAAATRPIVFIGYGLGALTAARLATGGHAATAADGSPAALFLVAPPAPDVVRANARVDPAFAEPIGKLARPTVLVASRNDPDCAYEDAAAYAETWGAQLADAGESGRLDSASGHGPWPEGLMRLAHFLTSVTR